MRVDNLSHTSTLYKYTHKYISVEHCGVKAMVPMQTAFSVRSSGVISTQALIAYL